ncbi:hypothetical protein Tco_0770879 [Tanacetum coccineum]|uniref:Uncharacterized protein n=1 Tax=Tanacetum coccineum TaxID=301880 RepID=A0ABQ4ZDG1_9ASTR
MPLMITRSMRQCLLRGRRGSKSLKNQVQCKKSLKITIRQKKVDGGEKDAQSYDDVDDSDNRLEPRSHKENPDYVDDDDDDKEEEKVDEVEGNEMGSLEIRTEKMQTPIPTIPRSPRINLSSDKNIIEELTDHFQILLHPKLHTSKYAFPASTVIFCCTSQDVHASRIYVQEHGTKERNN